MFLNYAYYMNWDICKSSEDDYNSFERESIKLITDVFLDDCCYVDITDRHETENQQNAALQESLQLLSEFGAENLYLSNWIGNVARKTLPVKADRIKVGNNNIDEFLDRVRFVTSPFIMWFVKSSGKTAECEILNPLITKEFQPPENAYTLVTHATDCPEIEICSTMNISPLIFRLEDMGWKHVKDIWKRQKDGDFIKILLNQFPLQSKYCKIFEINQNDK